MQSKTYSRNTFSVFTHTAIGTKPGVWWWLLRQHNVAPKYWFKAAFVFFVSVCNAPFQWCESLFYRKKIAATKVVAPIFIIGHPRSGTTFLHYVLSQNPAWAFCQISDGLAPNVMLLFGKFVRAALSIFMPNKRPQDDVPTSPNAPLEEEFALANSSKYSLVHAYYFPADAKEIFSKNVMFDAHENAVAWQKSYHHFLQKLTLKNGGKRLVLKSPANTARVREILALYPDAKFVHIHRDPQDVYQSNVKLYARIFPLLALQKSSAQLQQKAILKGGELMFKKLEAAKKSVSPRQFADVAYADFVNNPLAEMQRIFTELNLPDFAAAQPHFENVVRGFSDYKVNKKRSLSADEKEKIEKYWGFFYRPLGYKID